MSKSKAQIIWMSLRPQKGAPVEKVDRLRLSTTQGIIGDHYSGRSQKRQVTLMQKKFLDQVTQRMGFEVNMNMTRRNILVEHVTLTELIGKRFKLGTAVLEGTGHCKPCNKMEDTIGPGGWEAMNGLAGITAQVIKDGELKIGDELSLFDC